MRNLLIAACCAALIGGVSVASAQTTPDTTKSDTGTKMKKKSTKMKKSMKSGDSMSGAPKDAK